MKRFQDTGIIKREGPDNGGVWVKWNCINNDRWTKIDINNQ